MTNLAFLALGGAALLVIFGLRVCVDLYLQGRRARQATHNDNLRADCHPTDDKSASNSIRASVMGHL